MRHTACGVQCCWGLLGGCWVLLHRDYQNIYDYDEISETIITTTTTQFELRTRRLRLQLITTTMTTMVGVMRAMCVQTWACAHYVRWACAQVWWACAPYVRPWVGDQRHDKAMCVQTWACAPYVREYVREHVRMHGETLCVRTMRCCQEKTRL